MCWRHAGLKHAGLTASTPEEEDLPLVQLAASLQAAGMPCTIEDANRILTEDESLQTHGTTSDQDIIDEVLGLHTIEDEVTPSEQIADVVPSRPSHNQHMDVVNVIRLFASYGNGPDMERAHKLSLELKTIGIHH